MCVREIDPKETTRTLAFELWMKAPNPMVTFFKTYDVMPLIKVSKSRGMKFNMLLLYRQGCCFSKRILFIARGRQVDTV